MHAEAQRYGRSGALLFLDLDRFKYVNDTRGHAAGDSLLLSAAEAIRQTVRAVDLVGRLGGDEFAIAVRECSQITATQIAGKILDVLASLDPPDLPPGFRVTGSIGISMFPIEGRDVKELLANADLAMYQAKSAGRARWHVFSQAELARERLQEQVHWEGQLKRALEEDRFVLFYQPLLRTRDYVIDHYEILLRLRMDDGTLIAPGQFMKVAEESGLIRAIDRHVLRKAIVRLAELKHRPDISFSVNLSGITIGDQAFLDTLRTELDRTGARSSGLVLEITETSAVADFATAREFMDAVRKTGCTFAIDDFGAGFASFYYIKQLPVDYVKIDGAFIQNLAQSRDDQVFVKALTDVARGFGKATVAEFVEDEASLELLRGYGVDYAQGYYIGRPAPEILPPGPWNKSPAPVTP